MPRYTSASAFLESTLHFFFLLFRKLRVLVELVMFIRESFSAHTNFLRPNLIKMLGVWMKRQNSETWAWKVKLISTTIMAFG